MRVALWLLAEVGIGRPFTKAQLREAFPSIEQIDRRMRDLRADGWVIATYREDRSLSPEELRLVTVGGPVWEPGYRSRQAASVTDRQRRNVLAADDYACRYCGVGPGESYPEDKARTAKLSVARLPAEDGASVQLLTLCDRCLPAANEGRDDAGLMIAIEELDSTQREHLRSWVKRGNRPRSPAELLWMRYRRLPYTARVEVRAHLGQG